MQAAAASAPEPSPTGVASAPAAASGPPCAELVNSERSGDSPPLLRGHRTCFKKSNLGERSEPARSVAAVPLPTLSRAALPVSIIVNWHTKTLTLRARLIRGLGSETPVPVFLEKYLLPVTATLTVWLTFANPMGLDWNQRVSGGLALLFAAYFIGHTVHRMNHPRKPPSADERGAAPLPSSTSNPTDKGHSALSQPGTISPEILGQQPPSPAIVEQKTNGSTQTPRILLASALTSAGRPLPDDEEINAVRGAFPRAPLRIERNVTDSTLRRILTTDRFDIVILDVHVNADGSIDFDFETSRMAGEGLVKLLEVAGTKLVILGSCNSVPLAASLSNRITMVAATGYLSTNYYHAWLEIFFRLLASRRPVRDAFTIASDSVPPPRGLSPGYRNFKMVLTEVPGHSFTFFDRP
jgi:hypothetical protein